MPTWNKAACSGASQSTIDKELAQRLQLTVNGPPVTVTGVGSVTEAVPVRVQKWRIGKSVELPPQNLVLVNMTEDDRRSGVQGLLGSDVLSHFGDALIDYKAQVLALDPKRVRDRLAN
jgi:hypothetical protein